jgi:hypothetical protein
MLVPVFCQEVERMVEQPHRNREGSIPHANSVDQEQL